MYWINSGCNSTAAVAGANFRSKPNSYLFRLMASGKLTENNRNKNKKQYSQIYNQHNKLWFSVLAGLVRQYPF